MKLRTCVRIAGRVALLGEPRALSECDELSKLRTRVRIAGRVALLTEPRALFQLYFGIDVWTRTPPRRLSFSIQQA